VENPPSLLYVRTGSGTMLIYGSSKRKRTMGLDAHDKGRYQVYSPQWLIPQLPLKNLKSSFRRNHRAGKPSASALAALGAPVRTYHVGPYTVLVWNTNLLSPPAP